MSDVQSNKDDTDQYETSINYTIAGQFFVRELAERASKRLFNWEMYAYRLPHSEWLPAREYPALREILENFFPLKAGDTGPSGGLIIKCDKTPEKKGFYCVEAAPFDLKFATWQEAGQLCREFSHNGIGGWRLPTVDELSSFAHTLRFRLRDRENVYQTTETVINWSDSLRGETAAAVVTQENEDYYQPAIPYPMGGISGGYHKSKDGPWRGDEKIFPITHYYPVRPVRGFYAKIIFLEEKK
jgi:hypothetical protein